MRGVRRSFVPPAYGSTSPDLDGIAQDMALLELELAGAVERDRPLATGRRVARGDEITVVSYGAEREAHASIEEGCLRAGKPRRGPAAVVQRRAGQFRRAGDAR
jgi:hypothetical protein